jgi:MFS transporter, DHA3 family, multidrug efflux protein
MVKHFHRVLLNTLIANVTSSFLWFALTFWVYLETHSVMTTAIVGGLFMLLTSVFSIVFGTFVDHHKKKTVLLVASLATLVTYVLAGLVFVAFDKGQLSDWNGPVFWLFAGVILAGGVVGQMRNIALSTIVTLLVPEKQHAKANGLVGTVQGLSFMTTSVLSGLSIGILGMGWTLAIAIFFTAVSLLDLSFITIPEKEIFHDPNLKQSKVDLKGSIAAIKSVPGLFWLIIFTTFNNLVGGVFMALMDPYGLTLFSVETWGLVLGITSTGFVVGGMLIAKKGLGKNPLKTMLLINVVMAVIAFFFTIRELWWLYVVGIFIYMALIPVVEATEQTIIQKVVPFKRQGRVFGFAQTIEIAAAPVSAFIIGPLAEYKILPYMRSPAGQDRFSWLLGNGQARGIALVFIVASLAMLVAVAYAFTTNAYRQLSARYVKA